MRDLSRGLLAGALSWVLAAAAASPAALRAAESKAAKAPTAAQWKQTTLDSCLGSTTAESFSQFRQSKQARRPDALRDWQSRFARCEALASRDLGRCGQGTQGSPEDRRKIAQSCEESYPDYMFIAMAVRRDPALGRLCNMVFEHDDDFRKGSTDQVCSIYGAIYQGGELGNGCERLSAFVNPAKGKAKFMRECRAFFTFLDGPKACLQVRDAGFREDCANLAALLTAATSNDASLCGSSAECAAVISRSNQPCARLKAQAVRSFCEEEAATGVHDQMQEEIGFRKANKLPAYRADLPLLHLLPTNERMKYEIRNKKRGKPSGGQGEPEEAPQSQP